MSDKKSYYKKVGAYPFKKTLDINPMDVTDQPTYLKRRMTLAGGKSDPVKAGLKSVGILGGAAAAGYAIGKDDAKKLSENKNKKPKTKMFITRRGTSNRTLIENETKESPMKANPVGGKKKGMDQYERREYFGVKKRSTGGMMIGKGGDYIKDLL